jgi:hypothetical protein
MTRKQPEMPGSDGALDAVEVPRLCGGAMVTYFVLNPLVGADSFGQAVATGPEIFDPRTKDWWAPVRLPDQTVDLLPATLIVGITPGDAGGNA